MPVGASVVPSVKEQICEQASYTLHHINRAKLFTENSAMARIRDTLRGWGPADPQYILKRDSWCTISDHWCCSNMNPSLCSDNKLSWYFTQLICVSWPTSAIRNADFYLLAQDVIIILAAWCVYLGSYEINALAFNLDIDQIYSNIISIGNNYS